MFVIQSKFVYILSTLHWNSSYYVLQFCLFLLNWESLLGQQYISGIPHMSDNERIENFLKFQKFILVSQVPSASNCAEVRTILFATFVTSFNFVLFCIILYIVDFWFDEYNTHVLFQPSPKLKQQHSEIFAICSTLKLRKKVCMATQKYVHIFRM